MRNKSSMGDTNMEAAVAKSSENSQTLPFWWVATKPPSNATTAFPMPLR